MNIQFSRTRELKTELKKITCSIKKILSYISNHKISLRSIIVTLNTRTLNTREFLYTNYLKNREGKNRRKKKKRAVAQHRHLEKDNVDDSQFRRYYIVLSFFVSFSSLYPFSPCHSFYRRSVIISRLTGRSLIYDLPKAKLNFPPVIYTFWHFDLPSEIEPRFSLT